MVLPTNPLRPSEVALCAALTLGVLGKSTQTGPESPPISGGEGHGALKKVPLKVFWWASDCLGWRHSGSLQQRCSSLFPINVSNLI